MLTHSGYLDRTWVREWWRLKRARAARKGWKTRRRRAAIAAEMSTGFTRCIGMPEKACTRLVPRGIPDQRRCGSCWSALAASDARRRQIRLEEDQRGGQPRGYNPLA